MNKYAESQKISRENFSKRKKWYAAFQDKMNDLAISKLKEEHCSICNTMYFCNFCNFCKSESDDDPCVNAFRTYIKNNKIKVNFDNLAEVDKFVGEENDKK